MKTRAFVREQKGKYNQDRPAIVKDMSFVLSRC